MKFATQQRCKEILKPNCKKHKKNWKQNYKKHQNCKETNEPKSWTRNARDAKKHNETHKPKAWSSGVKIKVWEERYDTAKKKKKTMEMQRKWVNWKEEAT